MLKSIFAFLMSLVSIITSIPLPEMFTDESDECYMETSDYSVDGVTSMGTIMADALNEHNNDTSNENYYISDIDEINGDLVIDTNVLTPCSVTLNIIDENTKEIITSYEENVPAGESEVVIQTDNRIPEYYVIEAVLSDAENKPIGSTYVDEDETEWYEEFQNTTTDDFSNYNIVNLDDDKSNNFAVFNREVVVIDDTEQLIASKDNKLVFSNSDDIEQLEAGTVLAYNTDAVNEMVIGKVVDVSSNKTETVVTMEETTLEEAFCFVKISCDVENVFDDNHNSSYDSSEPQIVPNSVGVEGGAEYTVKFNFGKGPFSGSITLSASASVTLEYSVWERYASASLSFTPKASIHADVSYKTGRKVIPVASPSVWVYGMELKFSIKIVYEVSAKISFDANISAKYGFAWSTSGGIKNISTKPVVSASVNIEGHFYLGLQLTPSISPLGVATLSLTGEAGAQLNASAGWSYTTGRTEKHDCGIACISGDVDIKIQVSAGLKIAVFGWSIVDKSWSLWNKTFNDVLIFHYSIKYNEFGWNECTHYSHLLTFKVVDSKGNEIPRATIDGNLAVGGSTKLWYSDGKHTITVKAPGYQTKKYSFGSNDADTYTIVLVPGSSESVCYETNSSYSTYTRKKAHGSSGYGNSAYVAPLTYTVPAEGVVLSSNLANQRRSDVAWVQRELKKLGYSVTVDGYFGNSTTSAVKQFQRDYDLPVTGTVNANTLALIKKPMKKPAAPVLRITSSSEISSGEIVTLAWDTVEFAESYNIYIYNQNGDMIDNEVGVKSTTAAFILYEPGVYTVKAESQNKRGTSETSTLNSDIKVLGKTEVVFLDWDGTILSKQFVDFGKGAVAPAAPERDGHSFLRWDRDYSKVSGEKITVNAVYSKNQYVVKFLNTDGTVLSTEKCYFEDSAKAPALENLKIPSGYKFIGWNRDYSLITEDIVVKPILGWINDDLPIIIDDYTVTADEGSGYNVSVTIRNYEKNRTSGRVVVALKTASEKFVTMTESSAFTLVKSNVSENKISTTTIDIFVPCTEEIAYADIFVVDTYEDLIPISEMKRCVINSTVQADCQVLNGSLDSSFAGKQATLFIYKLGDAADYTNEFIGQTIVDSFGNYTFNYNLREEPSVKTGDFYVVLGIEGSDGFIFINKIEAPKPVYTVTIKDYDGSVLSVQEVSQGNYAVLPEKNPERPGYTFAGWDYTNTSINEDITITAVYAPKTYTVVFIDWTNKRFDMHTYHYGEPLVTPDLNNLDEYNTIGWEGVVAGQPVTENMVVTAKYDKKVFVVNFYDVDGNIISTQEVGYGESAQIPDIETSNNVEYYVWDDSKANNITQNTDIYPYFSFTEDTELPEVSMESGVYDSSLVLALTCNTKNAIIFYSIDGSEFKEYSEPISITETSEIMYYASSLGKNDSEYGSDYYIINDKNAKTWYYPVNIVENSEIISTYILEKGQKINSTTIPVEKPGYELSGFYKDEACTTTVEDSFTVNEATTLYVKFNKKIFQVSFKDVDGNVLSKQSVAYNESAVPPENITVPKGFVFVGWDKNDYYCVTEDVEIIAVIQDEKTYAKIELNRNTYTMMEGYCYSFVANVQSDGVYELIWNSDDESVAIVDQNGKVTAVSEGIAVITVYMLGKNAYAMCYVTVTENPELSITLKEKSSLGSRDNIIFGVSPNKNTVSDVIEEIESKNVRFYVGENELTGNAKISTGTVVRLYNEEGSLLDEKVVSVLGDVDGSGTMGVLDASRITRYLVGKDEMTVEALLAADVNADGLVNNKDASLVMRCLVGKQSV